MTSKTDHDIIIIGAGPSGLSFARSVADTGLNVLILERNARAKIENPDYDGRETALTHGSYDIMTALDIWDKIPEDRISLIKNAKVLNGNSSYALAFTHTEAGEDTLGYMVSNHLIKKAAYESLNEFKNITLKCGVVVKNVETDAGQGVVTVDDGTRITARLIVAADSRFSGARDMMGIQTSKLNFERTCIVGKMDVTGVDGKPNDTAYECFHYGRTLAILPLKNNQVSIVITAKTDDADDILAMNAADFAADITRRIEGRFGEMTLASDLYPYPLMGVHAKTFYARRFALLGDAAVGMHPVTAHGFNLGLRGGYTLAGEIKTALKLGGDIGAQNALSAYSRQHRRLTAPLYMGTNTIVKLFTTETHSAKFARRMMLRLGNTLKPAKHLIMNQLTDKTDTAA